MSLLLSPRVWVALAFAAVLAALGVQTMRLSHAHAERASLMQQYAEAARQAEADARAEETRRQAITDEEARHGQERIAAVEMERDAARADGDRLRDAIRAATSGARPNPGSASGGPGKPLADPIGMFAELLERADRRAETVSGYADRLRVAGETCERYGDGLQAPTGR
jgi:hypothetical protein